MKNELQFSVNDAGNRVTWRCEGTPLAHRETADFWRLMADDGYYLDMQVKSSEQTGFVTRTGNKTVIHYEKLVTDKGRVLDIALTLSVTQNEDRMIFESSIDNHDEKTRADELEFPYIELTNLCGKHEDDVLIRPYGLGERVENPWQALKSAHTEYKGADYLDIKASLTYPRPATMSWFGIQSGSKFLYIGRHDERTRLCSLLNALAPRGAEQEYLASAICHYPFVRPGETLAQPPVVVTMSEGDWRLGSDIYGSFARQSFYHPITPRNWVQNMTGWQRVILRHQYGEIFWKFKDLPQLYRDGKESGLDTLMVFGWWKGRFDNGYPHYEVDEELGGEQGLKDAIAEIKAMGGNVILYNNGILIDKKTPFYKKHGAKAVRIDIDGNEYCDSYHFENNGTLLRNYGYKTFVDACQAAEIWSDIMVKNAKQKLSFAPSSVFFDQIGGRCFLCFNPEHRHGYRPDDEMVYRRKNLQRIRALLNDEQALGTEVTNDSVSGEVDYVHGSEFGTSYYFAVRKYDPSRHLSAMFRRTFPEIIMTNRHVHDDADCCFWKSALNHAFITGLRFDVSIYRGRLIGIKGLPRYADYIKKLTALREKYHEFFYHGKFVCNTDLSLPDGVHYAEYEADGKRMFALWNGDEAAHTLEIFDQKITLAPQEVGCVIA